MRSPVAADTLILVHPRTGTADAAFTSGRRWCAAVGSSPGGRADGRTDARTDGRTSAARREGIPARPVGGAGLTAAAGGGWLTRRRIAGIIKRSGGVGCGIVAPKLSKIYIYI